MKRSDVKIAYIGGGSRAWARTFMYDLALQGSFSGSVNLYDINYEAAECNKTIGDKISSDPRAVSKFNYRVSKTLDEALTGADFVMVSILPGTFDEMESDVHLPEQYGILQAVGDTAGPGGLIRAMRAVPMYEVIAEAVKRNCPGAFVITFTNPMTLCTRTLYDVFPAIKAFGCCHEVFGTQAFLAEVVTEMTGEKNITRQDIKTDVQGINHFTWFTKAEYQGSDIFPIYKKYVDKHFDSRIGKVINTDSFKSANLVKMDLFRRYGQIAAAGDRHLVEFLNNSWYLNDRETVSKWGFALTAVKWRRDDLELRIRQTNALLNGETKPGIVKSDEDFVTLMEGLIGLKDFESNVNLPNSGQLPCAPSGAVVENNASFTKGKVTPLEAMPLFPKIQTLVLRELYQQENALSAIRRRNLNDTFNVFMSEPLCGTLSLTDGGKLFGDMVNNTKKYLSDWRI